MCRNKKVFMRTYNMIIMLDSLGLIKLLFAFQTSYKNNFLNTTNYSVNKKKYYFKMNNYASNLVLMSKSKKEKIA